MGGLEEVSGRNRSFGEFCVRGRGVRRRYSVSQFGDTQPGGIYFHGGEHRRHPRLFRRIKRQLGREYRSFDQRRSNRVTGLNNHTSSVGDEVNLGSANAGDILTFLMFIPPAANSTGPFTWSSDPTQNSDGIQHIYSTDVIASQAYAGSPAGTHVGWEDLPNGGDFDYNDDQYLFLTEARPRVAAALPSVSPPFGRPLTAECCRASSTGSRASCCGASPAPGISACAWRAA